MNPVSGRKSISIHLYLLANWSRTYSKIGISHAVLSRSWFALAAAEVAEATAAAAKIAASDDSTEQKQRLYIKSLVNFYNTSVFLGSATNVMPPAAFVFIIL